MKYMLNLIKTTSSAIWSICTYPYRAIRSLLFILIYPARVSFKPKYNIIIRYLLKIPADKYNEIRKIFTREHTQELNGHPATARIVNFDLHANMQYGEITEIQKKDSAKRYFESAIFTKDLSNIYNKNKQFIIMAGGNGDCYELYGKEMNAMADDNTNVIGFNPMGVGMSPGITSGPDDYQTAIKAIIDNLHKNGVPHDHIVLLGKSLGAAMCLPVAEQYQARGERVKVIADRTFARLDNTAGTMYRLLYYPVKFLVRLFGLNIDAATAFNKINKENPGDAIGLSADNDGVIPDSCNLYNGVHESMRQQGFVKKFSAYPLYRSFPAHNIPSEYIQENQPTINRRTGEEFIKEYRQIFKSQMTSHIIEKTSVVNDKYATDTLKPNSPAITNLKDAAKALVENAKFNQENEGLQTPLLQRKCRSNYLV